MSSMTDLDMIGRGKRWAYAGAITGGAVSIAANVGHSFVPAQPAGMDDGAWRLLPSAQPQPGSVMLAAFWPSALLLAIEILARVTWPDDRRWTVVRWGGVTPVAIVAAVVSYLHLSGLLHWYGEDTLTVWVGPFAVDGLMVVSTGALLALATRSVSGSDRIESTSPIGSIGSGADRIGAEVDRTSHPIGSDRVPDRVHDRIDPIVWDVAEPIESDPIVWDVAEEPEDHHAVRGGGAVVPIGSHHHEPEARTNGKSAARPEDVTKIIAAIAKGKLTSPPRVTHVMEHLGIGPTYARAAVKEINDKGSQGHQQGLQGHQQELRGQPEKIEKVSNEGPHERVPARSSGPECTPTPLQPVDDGPLRARGGGQSGGQS